MCRLALVVNGAFVSCMVDGISVCISLGLICAVACSGAADLLGARDTLASCFKMCFSSLDGVFLVKDTLDSSVMWNRVIIIPLSVMVTSVPCFRRLYLYGVVVLFAGVLFFSVLLAPLVILCFVCNLAFFFAEVALSILPFHFPFLR